jgi:cholesterol 7alpha-monooxygenase
MLLAVLWASQANTAPATFWSIAFLILPENKNFQATMFKELEHEIGKERNMSDEPNLNSSKSPTRAMLHKAAVRLAMDRKSCISRCVAESIRIRSHSIDLRIAAADLDLMTSTGTKVHLPKGRLLAICPFDSHHDQNLYKDAWSFNPDRTPLELGDGVTTSIAGEKRKKKRV